MHLEIEVFDFLTNKNQIKVWLICGPFDEKYNVKICQTTF